MSHEARVSLLVGEVGGEDDAQRVSGGGDDLLTWNRLRVRLVPPTEQTQNLRLCLHLRTETSTKEHVR